jgi:hypothetical protein
LYTLHDSIYIKFKTGKADPRQQEVGGVTHLYRGGKVQGGAREKTPEIGNALFLDPDGSHMEVDP